MIMKEMIDISPNHVKEAVFLCQWNDNETVEIHTIPTLFKKYGNTNIYNFDDGDDIDYKEFSSDIFSDMSFESALDEMRMDDDLLFEPFICDNMTIRRIK